MIDPFESEVEEMLKAFSTPSHSDPLKALLNQPLTGTFDQPRAKGEGFGLKRRIGNVLAVLCEISLNLSQRLHLGFWKLCRIDQPGELPKDLIVFAVA